MPGKQISKAELEERVTDLQQMVRFCTCNYAYHHKNDDGQILAELDAMLQHCKAQLVEVFKQMENMETLIANTIQQCNDAEALLHKRKHNYGDKILTPKNCVDGDGAGAGHGVDKIFVFDDVEQS